MSSFQYIFVFTGNLKHKDLRGQVVSSQAYVDDGVDSIDEDPEGAVDVDPQGSVPSASENSENEWIVLLSVKYLSIHKPYSHIDNHSIFPYYSK